MLAPMRQELAPVVRALKLQKSTLGGRTVHTGKIGTVDIVATMIGMGTERARRATTDLLEAATYEHVVVLGVAGGIAHEIELGDLVVPEVVVDRSTGSEHRQTALGHHVPAGTIATGDDLLDDEHEFARLIEGGVVALDMETSAVAQVCEARGVPWSAFRGISDRPRDGLVDQAVFALGKDDGTADLVAVAKYLAADPRRVKVLSRLARDLQVATTAAAAAAIVAIRDTDFDAT
jgi:adenosylhomocysteine nucleosidase